MTNPVAFSLAAVLIAISLLHFAWAAGVYWPGKDPLSLSDKVMGAAPGASLPPAWSPRSWPAPSWSARSRS